MSLVNPVSSRSAKAVIITTWLWLWLFAPPAFAGNNNDQYLAGARAAFQLARQHHANGDEAGALAEAEKAIAIFAEVKARPEQVCGQLFLAERLRQAARFPEAIAAAQQAITLCCGPELKLQQGHGHKLIGECHYALGQLDQCLEEYHWALKIYEELKQTSLADETTVDIIGASTFLESEQKSVDYAYQFLNNDKNKSDLTLAKLYTIITQATFMQFPEQAVATAHQALAFAEKAKATAIMVDNLSLLGHSLLKTGYPDEAGQHLERARAIVEKNNLKGQKNLVYNNLARYYFQRNDFDEASRYAELGLDSARRAGIFIGEYIAYSILHDIASKRKRFAKADSYSQKIISINRGRCKDKLVQAQKAQTIKYDLRARDKEIELLKKEKSLQELSLSRQRLLIAFITTGMLLTAGLAAAIWLIYRSNARRLEVEARLSRRDPLTGLFNRRAMYEILDQEIDRWHRNQLPFSVLMADIDSFKRFNNIYGHNCGDMVLSRVAETLTDNLRKQDQIARWGGEEFLILLPDTNSSGATNLAEKLRQQIAAIPLDDIEENLCLTMSFGVSQFIAEGNIEVTIKAADSALYRAKNNGRNRVMVNQVPTNQV